MSTPSAAELVSALTTDETALPLGSSVRTTVTGVAFWAAIVLPFLHLPLLTTGLETTALRLAFVCLLTLNLVAVLVGHTHARD